MAGKRPKWPKGIRPVVRKHWKRIDKTVTRALDELGEERGKSALHGVNVEKDLLGAGMWGVIYPTNSPRWVVKVTADPTEGPIIAAIMDDPALRNHPAISYYAGLWRLPTKAKRDEWHMSGRGKSKRRSKQYTTFVVLRENIDPTEVLEGEDVPEYQFDIKELLDGDYDERSGEVIVRGLRDAADELNEAILEGDEEEEAELNEELDEFLEELSEFEETEWLSNFMWGFRHLLGGVLADVHSGNVGARTHNLDDLDLPKNVRKTHQPGPEWILFDPGHSEVEAQYRIPMLRNPALLDR